MKEEKHVCDNCEKTVFGNGEVYLLKDNSILCLKCYHKAIKTRLDYLRKEIEAERISTAEIPELQSLADHIDKNDTLLLEWAGVPE